MFTLENIMTKDVITVNKETTIKEAIRIMVENNIIHNNIIYIFLYMYVHFVYICMCVKYIYI